MILAFDSSNPPLNTLDRRLQSSRWSEFLTELLTNSGHFLVLYALSEVILISEHHTFQEPAHFLIILAILCQAWYLSHRQAHRFWGNLIGPTLYTLLDFPLDGLSFFSDPLHYGLWGFFLAIATLQGLRFHWWTQCTSWVMPLEGVIRMGMIFVLYWAITYKETRTVVVEGEITQWFMLPQHRFLVVSLIISGLLIGLQALQVTRQREKLQETAQILRNLAEWGMGSHVVLTAVTNPKALEFRRCDRAILFMDIRGFTQWCEPRDPDQVAQMLNHYYQAVEPIATQYCPVRVTFTADEVMVIYQAPDLALAAALAMQKAVTPLLKSHHLGAGCGLHYGSVIEGLFGSTGVRTYTVIGDVVNTAKRIESATPPGSITISDDLYQMLSATLAVQSCPPLKVKGKEHPLVVWRLLSQQQTPMPDDPSKA